MIPLETEEVEVITETPSVAEPVVPVTKISFRDSSQYVTLLIVLFIILLGGVIFLIGAAIILSNK